MDAILYCTGGIHFVFAPLSRWSEVGTPDLVYIFANADQLSALVTMQGFHNGKALNTIAPFGAA